MTEQNQQEALTIALTKESNDTDQNTPNVDAEYMKLTTENENSGENKIDTKSINDITLSNCKTMDKKGDENKNLNNTNGSPSADETVNRKVTVEDEDEDPKESLLEENKISDDTNSKDDATNPTPSTSETVETVDVAIPQKKKKKKKKKKKSGEDDASLDFHDSGPREEDEDRLYDPSKSLAYRVEIAVQKYKKNRKFSSTRNQVFNSYLRFGGISTGPKSFLGQDGLDNADADADEIAARRATDFIDDDEIDDTEVNFTYIVRVYLSSFLIDKSGYVQMDQFREAPQVVISFLNYLFNHKVCPEYEDDMQEALRVAHIAKDELPNCKALAQNAPGKLNKACSLLFGGELYGMLDDPWNGEETVAKMIGISKEEGKRLIKELFGVNAIEELTQVKEDSRTALTCKIIGVEPFPLEGFTDETRQNSNGENPVDISEDFTNETHQNSNGEVPVDTSEDFTKETRQNSNGKNPVDTSEDSTNETHQGANGENPAMNSDEPHLKKIVLREYDVSTAEPFYVCVGSDLGNYATPEMRITADFHKLSNGFWYWDKVTNVYPSYYQPCEDDSDDDD